MKKYILLLIFTFLLLLPPSQTLAQQMLVTPARDFTLAKTSFQVGSNETWVGISGLPLPFRFISPLGLKVEVGSRSENWKEWDRYRYEVDYILKDIILFERNVGSIGIRYGMEYTEDFITDSFYLYVPYSLNLSPVSLHLNIGAVYNWNRRWIQSSRTGIRTDYHVSEKITIVGEVIRLKQTSIEYDDGRYYTLFQKGIQYNIIPDRLELKLTAGNNFKFRNKKARPWISYYSESIIVYETSKSRNMNVTPELPFFNLGLKVKI